MSKTMTTTISNAIARSVSRNEIVNLQYVGPEDIDDLVSAADDSVRNGQVLEAWGTTDDGDEWRVHAHLTVCDE